MKAARPSGRRYGDCWPSVGRRVRPLTPGPSRSGGRSSTADSPAGSPTSTARPNRFFLHHGTPAAILLAVVCVVVAVGVFLPPQITQLTLVVAIVVFAVIWVAVQNFGGILAGGATDPNSGLLVILLALIYWPLSTARPRCGRQIVGSANRT